jgi:hypothetical protein
MIVRIRIVIIAFASFTTFPAHNEIIFSKFVAPHLDTLTVRSADLAVCVSDHSSLGCPPRITIRHRHALGLCIDFCVRRS